MGAVGTPDRAKLGAIDVVIVPEPDPVTAPVNVKVEPAPEALNNVLTKAVVAI